jgi:peptidoglycan/xylan/chitin deacetylase (PgdA/CDA1 family)
MLKYTHLYMAVTGVILSLTPCPAPADIEADKSTAVVFAYQHIGEDSVPQGNISVEQFREHLSELKKGGYAVLPLPKIIDALKNRSALPPQTIGITFEGAYQATLANALPLLEDANLPYTVFFASDALDGNNPTRMNWKQIKKLKKNGLASLGILPAAYGHLVAQTPEQASALINRAVARYREMLDEEPAFFAYPYGEFTAALKKQVAPYKFRAVFGMQSGALHAQSDFLALPRFTMTNDYGDIDRFMLTANALPLPVSDVIPEDTILTQNPPTIGFTVTPDIGNLSKLSCFASNLGRLPLTHVGGNRIEIRPEQPFPDRRTRINCTLPDSPVVTGKAQSWRWFGMMLIAPALGEDDTTDSDAPAEEPETPEDQ